MSGHNRTVMLSQLAGHGPRISERLPVLTKAARYTRRRATAVRLRNVNVSLAKRGPDGRIPGLRTGRRPRGAGARRGATEPRSETNTLVPARSLQAAMACRRRSVKKRGRKPARMTAADDRNRERRATWASVQGSRSPQDGEGASVRRRPAPARRHLRTTVMRDPGLPDAQGLYNPANEHDSCGVGFVADMKNAKSHAIVAMGLQILLNLDHRGAVGADPKAGDGCGMLVQIPHRFLREECAALGISLPQSRRLCRRALCSCRATPTAASSCEEIVEKVVADEGQMFLGWRDVPGRQFGPRRERQARPSRCSGRSSSRPARGIADQDDFERRLFILRKVISNTIYDMKDPRTKGFYPVSLSSRTHRLQGHAAGRPARRLLQGSARPALRVGARARAPALLDQHLPDLVARASLPDGRPQRRDQHAARQRELDGGAPGLGRLANCSVPRSRSSGRSPTRASRTRPASTTRSSSSCRAATRWPTR